MSQEDDEEEYNQRKKSEAPPPRRQPKKIIIPRRSPSIVIPSREVVYITADKTTCKTCPCYPREEPYQNIKKINPCRKSPLSLYDLASKAVDDLKYPHSLLWTEEDVANWVAGLGLPQYQDCFLSNNVNGLRLIMFENPSRLPEVNIHDFHHILKITESIRRLYGTDFIRFSRSIGLPFRRPLTYCTWFKSRTGPSWGIRKNWNRCDLLRCMKIIKPIPPNLDHWDLVWYQKPDFPKTRFARIQYESTKFDIPQYEPNEHVCKEYTVPRKFRFQSGISESAQVIWMEHRPGSPEIREKSLGEKPKKMVKLCVPKDTRLMPKKIDPTGLAGKRLLLARRKMAKPKFLAR